MSTAGYSGTPLPRKLGIRDGSRVLLVGAPADFAVALGELPPGVQLLGPGVGDVDVAVLFALEVATLRARFAPLATALRPAGGLWVAWPKRSSGVATELSENVVRERGPRRRPGRQQGLRDRCDLVRACASSGGCATGRDPDAAGQRLKTPTRAAAPAITAITATATATTRSSRSGGSSSPDRIASSTRCQRR